MEGKEYAYQKNWKDFRRRLVFFTGMFIGVLLAHLLFFYTMNYFSEDIKKLFECVLLFGWAVFLISLIRISIWNCPRCGENYFPILRKTNLFSDFSCQNCNLAKYEGSDFKRKKLGKRFGF